MKKLSWFQKIAYGLPEGASQMILSMIGLYSMFFYSDVLGLDSAVVGTIFLVARIISIFTDPVMGLFMDSRKPLRGEKYIPYATIGAVLYGLSTVALFLAPDLPTIWKIVYVVITYNLYNILYSFFEIPYGSVLSTVTSDYDEINQIGIIRGIVGGICMTAIGYCTDGLLGLFSGKTGPFNAYTYTAAIFAAAIVLTAFVFRKSLRERLAPEATAETSEEPAKMGDIVKVVSTNKPLMTLVTANFISNVAWTLRDASLFYYFAFVLQRPDMFGAYVAVCGVFMLPIQFVLPKLSQKFGNRNVIIAGCIFSLCAFAVLAVTPLNLWAVMICGALSVVAWGVLYSLLYGMTTHTVEYGEWKTGVRTAGVCTSLVSTAFKLGMGVSGFIMGILLKVGNYVDGAAVQSGAAVTAIISAFTYIPAILGVVLLLLICTYKLDKQYPTILKELEERRGTQV